MMMFATTAYATISFLQGNLNKSIVASSDLEHSISRSGPEALNVQPLIVLLQEPHVKCFTNRTKLSSIPQGYWAILPRAEDKISISNTGNWPRTAIMVNSIINAWPVPQFTSRDCTVIQVNLNFCTTYLVSLYLDQTKLSFPDSFLRLLQQREGKGVLVGADSNAHSSL